MEIAIMVEGQDGINWGRWQRLAQTVQNAGFAGLYRSDHFTNPSPPDHHSLDAWMSMMWLASHSTGIDFGPLVSPVSFRHPVFMARHAIAINNMAGGRFTLGVGAGWQEREHRSFGFTLGDMDTRFARLEEGLEVITRLLRSDEPVSFAGEHYQLHEARLLPPPDHRIPILIGGNGMQRTLPLVAKYADEWNGVFIAAEAFAERNQRLDELLAEAGRPNDAVKRSLMTGVFFGRDEETLQRKLRGRTPQQLEERGMVYGTPDGVRNQLSRLEDAGVQRVMLNWFDLDDMTGLEHLAAAVL